MSAQHTLGPTRYVIVVIDDDALYFHFWDRSIYGEPQFGDLEGAKRYPTLSGCLSRVRALRRDGYDVAYQTAPAAIVNAAGATP